MFSFKQLEYYIASEVIYHIRCYNGNKQRYSLTDRRERQGEGWNANFCRLSHTAGLTVWHVWWMVLHWYCWPLTSTHCHQSRDKEEEKGWGGKKHPAAQAAEAVDASFHHLTHKRAQTHADAPFSPHKSTGTNIKAHTHSNAHSLLLSHPDNLYPTAVCICWAKPFCFWLLNQFSLSPDRLHQRLMQQLQPYESKGFWDYAKKQVFHHKLHICYTSHCRREWIRGEVHTGKQLEIKNGTGRGKLLCWQEQSSHYSSYPPGTGRGRAAKQQRLPPSLHWWVCLKGQDRSVNLFHKYECKNLSTIPRKYHENGLFTHYSLILCGGCFKFYALLFQYFIKNFYLNATWICSMTLCQ